MKIPALAVVSLFSASLAFAQEATPAPAESPAPKKPMTPEELMKRYDKNVDGSVTLEEYSSYTKDKEKSKAMFEKRDKNKDGKLTVDEIGGKAKPAAPAEKKE